MSRMYVPLASPAGLSQIKTAKALTEIEYNTLPWVQGSEELGVV